MLRPTYSLALGATTLSSSGPGSLAALLVRRGKNGAADEAVIVLGTVHDATVTEGDEASIELGWDGSTELVFTGVVEAVESGIGSMRVHCLGHQIKLMQARRDRTFIKQSAGQVVTALAGDVGVGTDTVEDGIDLPVYLVDSTLGLYGHCLELARRCGFDLYTTEEGKLVFSQFVVTSADRTFRYGEQIIAASIESEISLDTVTVIPESPASTFGDDTASWFVKDPSPHQGKAGSGPVALPLSDPLLRTKDAADTAARARLYFSQRDAVTGYVELMGNPQAKLGEAVALDGVPKAGVDGVYQVMAVRHLLEKRLGFRTVLTLGGIP